jgi:hypothetical protein
VVRCQCLKYIYIYLYSERERHGEESGVVKADYKKWRCSKMNETGPS